MLTQAIEAEVAEWIETHRELRDAAGRRQMVRNGRLPKRTIFSCVGPLFTLSEVEPTHNRDAYPCLTPEKNIAAPPGLTIIEKRVSAKRVIFASGQSATRKGSSIEMWI